ncbi:hypothetical protein [Actinomadura harenae]|uniref:Secreted protein n=1 Tax=Actinomadura harenae TaxID=2483351 RepID=A0A3M2LZJ9_9ACTN|nr:hypothetical protein [Actinomadura harenae]RMI42572.1 hypothetical protein EBO15_19240 [Actinomadura harenae]
MARRSTVLFGALAAAALAQTISVAGPARADETQKGEVIICDQLDMRLPNVSGRHCDTGRRGPLHDFVITHRENRHHSFFCRTGWAEGHLWVRGHDCRPRVHRG